MGWLRVGGDESQSGHTSDCGRIQVLGIEGLNQETMGIVGKGGGPRGENKLSFPLKTVQSVSYDSLLSLPVWHPLPALFQLVLTI